MMWMGAQALQQWIGTWNADIRFHVYLQDKDASKLEELKKALLQQPGIHELREVHATEQRAWLQAWLGVEGEWLDRLVERLPQTLEIVPETRATEAFATWSKIAEGFGAEINREEYRLAQASEWAADVVFATGFATLVLALAMAVIITNALHMNLIAKADEIELMRLLGAQEWFVRMPFILEGMGIGGFGALVAWILAWPVHWLLSPWVANFGVRLDLLWLVLPMVFGGCLIGALAAWIAAIQARNN